MIAVNGRIIAQGSQFSLRDVEVVSATIDIEDVRAHRAIASRSMQAASSERYHRVEVPFALSDDRAQTVLDVEGWRNFEVRYHRPEEEIALVFIVVLHFNAFMRMFYADLDLLAGYGIIYVALAPKVISFHSVVELIAVQHLSSFSQCVDSLRRRLGKVVGIQSPNTCCNLS